MIHHGGEIQPGGEGGDDRHGHQHGDQNRSGNGDGNIGVQLPGFFLNKHHRKKYQHRGHGGGKHRRPDFLDPAHRRANSIKPFAPFHLDAFQHHNGVIQRHTDSESNAGHGDDIDGPPGQQQPQEGGNGTDGNTNDAHSGNAY